MSATEHQSSPSGAKKGAAIDNNALARSALKQAPWQAIAVIGQAVLQVALVGVLARVVAPADFGLVAIASIALSFAAMFSEIGLGPALIQRLELTEKHVHAGFTLSLLLSGVLFVICEIAAPWIAILFREPLVTPVVRALAFSFVLNGPSLVAEALLQRELAFKRLMWVRLAAWGLGYAPVGVTLAWLGFGVWSLVAATLTQVTVQTVLMLSLQPHKLRLSLDRAAVRELVSFGFGLTLTRLLNMLVSQVDRLVIGRWLGARSLGQYQLAAQFTEVPMRYASQVIGAVLYPALSRVQDDKGAVATAFARTVGAQQLVFAPAGLVLSLLAGPVVVTILGPGWSEAILPLAILAPALALRGVLQTADVVVRTFGAVYWAALWRLVSLAVVVSAAMIGLRWGLVGVTFAAVLGQVVMTFLSTSLALRIAGAGWRDLLLATVPGLRLAVVSCAAASLVLAIDNWLPMPQPIVLALASSSAASAMIAVILLRPRSLGDGGLWLVHQLERHVPRWAILARVRAASSERYS